MPLDGRQLGRQAEAPHEAVGAEGSHERGPQRAEEKEGPEAVAQDSRPLE